MPSPPRAARSVWRLPLALFLAFWGLYGLTASGRVSRVADEFEVYWQTESLWLRGSQDVPQAEGTSVFFGRQGQDGRLYAPYGPGMAWAALPFHVAGRALARGAGLTPARPMAWTESVAAVTSLATSFWAAFAVVGLFRVARHEGASEARALWLAGLLGLGSLLWPYATVFYSEAVAAALVVWAALAARQGRALALAALLAGLVLVKSTNAAWVPALLVLAATQRDWRSLGWGLGGAGLGLTVHLVLNWIRFGGPFEVPYDWSETITGRPVPFALGRLPTGLAGLLLSPGKSLVLFSPPLLLFLWPGLWRGSFPGRARGLLLAAGVGLGVGLLVFGSYFFWEGGYAFGPRHLVPVLPLILLPLARAPRLPRGLLLSLLLAGGLVGFFGSSISFLEDQALGEDLSRQRYYAILADPPPGTPSNVYRFDYQPWTSYPQRWVDHLTRGAKPRPGEGLEFLRAHLLRVRRFDPALPRWLPWGISAFFMVVCGAGIWLLQTGYDPVSRKSSQSGSQESSHFVPLVGGE